MALIKCPKCGKTISDSSDICFHCGCQLNLTKLDAHNKNDISNFQNELMGSSSNNAQNNENDTAKCPMCGSSSLSLQEKGFSYGKAAAGAVLVGGVGLLAGGIGAKKRKVVCLNCGNEFEI